MNYRLTSLIAKNLWAIEEGFAESQLPIVASLFGHSQVNVSFEFQDPELIAETISPDSTLVASSRNSAFDDIPAGSIAVIGIKGTMLKDDQFCGAAGTATIGKIIQNADNSPAISGILLHIDSPGGSVDGTATLAEIVANTNKPIIAFADGLMASAAIWVGSAADKIIASANKTVLGSIGTLLSFADLQPAYEKLGVKFHLVTADQSTDKTRSFQEIRDGKYDNYKKEVLNPITEDFINHIKQSRPNVKDDQLTGKTFFAESLVGTLIDQIGNFQFALDQLQMLIDERQEKTQNTNSNKSLESMNLPLITGLLGDLESSDEGIFLNEEQLTQLEAAIADENAEELATANSERDTAQTALDTANTLVATLQEQVATLTGSAGEETAAAISKNETVSKGDKTSKNVVSDDKEFWDNVKAVEKEFLS